MDNTEYLKQISQTVRPEKKSMGWMSSPIFKVAVGGIIAFILIMIIGSVLSNGKASLKQQTISLKFHVENTLDAISSYKDNLKSSNLRSSSVSLSSVLSDTKRKLTEYTDGKYSKKDSDIERLEEEAVAHKEELEADLFEAKISGILDRTFAHKMALEISLITAEEASIYDASKDENLQSILESSYNSLNNLYNNFNDFSETK